MSRAVFDNRQEQRDRLILAGGVGALAASIIGVMAMCSYGEVNQAKDLRPKLERAGLDDGFRVDTLEYSANQTDISLILGGCSLKVDPEFKKLPDGSLDITKYTARAIAFPNVDSRIVRNRREERVNGLDVKLAFSNMTELNKALGNNPCAVLLNSAVYPGASSNGLK